MTKSHTRPSGAELEEQVAAIEGLLLPTGFEVTTNRRIHNDNGVQVAEFDVEIRGKLGSGHVAWLIECRNRPSEGPAPGAWIEQLVGRRARFNFNKVTAVSTTGFAEGAAEYAKQVGIDLREVQEIAPELVEWLTVRFVTMRERQHTLHNANVWLTDNEPPERIEAAMQVSASKTLGDPQIRSVKTNDTISLTTAFIKVVEQNPHTIQGIIPNQPATPVRLRAEYPQDDSHYVIDTPLGSARITHIDYEGEIGIIEKLVPLSQVAEYQHVDAEQSVAQTAAFKNEEYSVALHRVTETGAIQISIKTNDQGPDKKT